MGFYEELLPLAERFQTIKNQINTEEATKMSMIIPFFQFLGYDVFNPNEFCPEFTADVGIKKGEKVDYAIILNGEPQILVECKWCGEELNKHGSQLFRYFGATKAKFGILTNGIIYRFFTDLEKSNVMDLQPFLEINMLDLREQSTNELKKFCKDQFDKDNIFSTASDLKYTNLIKDYFNSAMNNPPEQFVKAVITDIYDGQKSQKVIERFTPLVKKSFSSFISEIINQRLNSVIKNNTQELNESQQTGEKQPNVEEPDEVESKIITTQEEIESFFIIRGLLVGIVNIEDIVYRDTESYFGILFKDNNRKPICRLNLDTKRKQLLIPNENKNFERIYIESLNDIYLYKDKLIASAKQYL